MDQAKAAIRQTLDQVKAFLAQEFPPKLTEADTKANFIEPIISAIGWTGIGSVTREYYVKNSQEFIDYVMRGPSGLLLAIEAKALQADLTDKAAAQLIQYCSVEGIEWAALTNGRELQFFNTFLKPDLGAKRILSLDLLAFNSDEEFDALYEQIEQLSRENMTTPTGVRTWLNQRRLDTTLRSILFDPSSSVTRQLRKTLDRAEVKATPQEIVQWFRSHLGTPMTVIPDASRHAPEHGNPEHRQASKDLAEEASQGALDQQFPRYMSQDRTRKKYFGISLPALVTAGLLHPGEELILATSTKDVATARLSPQGEIVWEGHNYVSPSNKAFAALLGRQSLNGWTSWFVERPTGRQTLDEIRTSLQETVDQPRPTSINGQLGS